MRTGRWITLFNGRDLIGWRPVLIGDAGSKIKEQMSWQAASSVSLHPDDDQLFLIEPGEGILVNGVTGRTANLMTETLHSDCELHVEFVVPRKSNSGVYLMGHYEIQVLDSWGEPELKFSSCGGIYARWIDGKAVGGAPPRVNASRPPGEWQSYDVIFRAPKFDSAGRKLSNAVFGSVVWNGVVVHEKSEVDDPTRASLPDPEQGQSPLMLQGDHGPVAYRNIRMRQIC